MLKNGGLLLLAPADDVFWMKNLSVKLASFESKIAGMKGLSGKEVWISGRFGEAARAGFEASGWKVKEDAGLVLLKSNQPN